MFGYVRIHKPSLTCGDYERYRGVYCSLCTALGRRYGPLARLGLNYDMTFLALLAMAREPECPAFAPGRCPLRPWKRCPRCKKGNRALAWAADASMAMLCFHWRDSLADGRWVERLLWALPAPVFLCWGKLAQRRAPEAWRVTGTAVAAQRLVEREEAPSLDACAHPSAHALGVLLAQSGGAAEDTERAALYRLGYLLGRWVYLADAADDYEADTRKGDFNPFLLAAEAGEDWRERSREALNATAAQLLEAWDALPVQRFRPILENILTRGLQATEKRVFNQEKSKRRERWRA
ncbi:MAG: DUF5685 family protein [Oscillospiraceae bacterium]|nr:DUF5685 family protein [Oscillospiraceae bacterium]